MIEIREYQSSDFQSIENLYSAFIALERNEEFRIWLDQDNPNQETLFLVAEIDGIVVGYIKGITVNIRFRNDVIKSLVTVEAAVSKEHQAKGVYSKLCKRLYRQAKAQGCQFRMEFPMPGASLAQTNHLGATYIEDIPVHIQIYSFPRYLRSRMKNKTIATIMGRLLSIFSPIINKKKKITPMNKYKLTEKEDFSSDAYRKFWDDISGEMPLMIDRSPSFMTWRYKMHPSSKEYRPFFLYLGEDIKGISVVKIEKKLLDGESEIKIAYIMEFLALNEEAATQLVYHIDRYCNSQKVHFNTAWVTDFHPFGSVMKSAGYRPTKVKIAFVGARLDEQLSEEWLRGKNWFISPGDSDIF